MTSREYNRAVVVERASFELETAGLTKGDRFLGLSSNEEKTWVYLADNVTEQELVTVQNVITAHVNRADYDITAVGAPWKLYLEGAKDIVYVRSAWKTAAIPVWETLSGVDKRKLVEWYIYPVTFTQADIDALFTAAQQVSNWRKLVEENIAGRTRRVLEASKKISFYITAGEALDLYSTVKTNMDLFRDTGSPHLMLWTTNGVYAPLGIDYSISGFAQKSYYSDVRRDLLIDIINNGNY